MKFLVQLLMVLDLWNWKFCVFISRSILSSVTLGEVLVSLSVLFPSLSLHTHTLTLIISSFRHYSNVPCYLDQTSYHPSCPSAAVISQDLVLNHCNCAFLTSKKSLDIIPTPQSTPTRLSILEYAALNLKFPLQLTATEKGQLQKVNPFLGVGQYLTDSLWMGRFYMQKVHQYLITFSGGRV